MTRHEFLRILHQVLQPESYLEIGVQHGDSLRLAQCPADGIDPNADPELEREIPNASIFRVTSDVFFEPLLVAPAAKDLIFIDGDHLIEQVCRDFGNVERWCCHSGTLVVLDDVLPYSQAMGSRVPCPGDWSGDAWKMWYLLNDQRSYDMRLVDVSPAGLLLVHGFHHHQRPASLPPGGWPPAPEPPLTVNMTWATTEVPDEVLRRSWAVRPDEAVEWVQGTIVELPEWTVQPGGPPLPPGDIGIPLESVHSEADQDR